jgi:ATP-dependent DNA helicase PIF1
LIAARSPDETEIMSILETVKRLLGVKPVDIGELNRRATKKPLQDGSGQAIKNPLAGVHVSDEYKAVESFLNAGCPAVFVTGNAGTGKSTLIQYLRTVLKKKMVVVAPTGVAALNVGGATIHSFFQFPPKIHEDEDIKLVYDRKLYQKLDFLIIDEVSMVRCDLMDSIDKFLRKNRSSDMPFGGVQLLLIGDLFQLPPVVPRHEMVVLNSKGYASPYFFSSFSLQKSSMVPVELTSVCRQDDNHFISLLNRIRTGDDIETTIAKLNAKCYQRKDVSTDITLTCTNNRSDQINMKELHQIPEKEYAFKGEIKGRFSLEEDKLPSPFDLRLKVGARVMFTKNDDNRRWVNGTLGIIRTIDRESVGIELVTDHKGKIYDVQRITWETYKYAYDPVKDKIVAEKVGAYTQYPLMLAWAVTIHKSQGKTLDNVLVDLGNAAFASGQVYVALSRCRSMAGISLQRPIRKTDVKCDPVIKRFYLAMNEMKKAAEPEQAHPTNVE